MEPTKKKSLQKTALKLRRNILTEVYSAASGHPGGSLSLAEVMSYLYFSELHVDPKNPRDPERDRFVLSKGHCTPALYGILAQRGFFSEEELPFFRQHKHILQGHPDMNLVPGVDMSTGSLGQGISTACGMALSAKISGKSYRIYAVMGDGELEEGQCWEAAMFAAHYKLDNLVAWVDFNGLQIDGDVTKVMNPTPIPEKFAAFGWNVIELPAADDLDAIESAYAAAKAHKGAPTVIVAHSVKGRGVSFMENNAAWHGSAPNKDQYEQAIAELDEAEKALEE